MFQIAPDVVNFNIETLLPLIGPRTNDQRDEITDVIYAFLAPYTILAYGLGVAVGKRLGPQPFASSFKGGEK
ncbi:MAG: hypothetical protein ABIW19_13045 [Vicinamibacterales bacterium]